MLHREYNSKVAWPGTKQMESYSLAVTKRLWFFSPNINSFHTVAHNYPHDQGPVDTSQSPLTTACTFHLWGLLSPKAGLLTYSVFLLSSLAPFLTTLLLSNTAPPFPSLIMSYFSLTDWILEMLLDTSNENSWQGKNHCIHHLRYIRKKVRETSYPWAILDLWV